LKIGDIEVATPVFLAPMSGVTDSPVRRLAAELGAGLVVSEMTASDELANGHKMSRLRCEATGIGPHVVQLAGCEAHWMAEGARIAEAGGADIIDINMGCPARHVTGGQSGSALMRDLDHAVSLIDATIAAVKVPVTLKMRLGWDDHTRNAPELARRAEVAGIKLVTAAPAASSTRARPIGMRSARCAKRSPFRSSSMATSPLTRRRSRRWRPPAPMP
jgi:tRNA-dihydrouridine synthase